MVISWWGALIGLALAIYLILKKLNPVYSLMLGAIIGALLGGASLTGTIDILVKGEQSVMGTVLRVLAAGMLAGVMMESGAAETLARTIVDKLGDRMAILSLALATMVITAVGVFIPVAVLIVAPIALEVGRRMHISKLALLVALSGGGKAGNIISPNANTIAAAKGFGLELSQVMIADFIPAVVALIVTVIVARLLVKKGDAVMEADLGDMVDSDTGNLPTLGQAVVTPILAIVLLLLNPIGQVAHLTLLTKVNLDATYVLPFAAIVGALVMKKGRELRDYARVGMTRMTDVVLILIGAGAIVIDQLPQGNYFHVTANAMHMDLRQRSQGILYEAMVGGSAMLTATILYGFLHLI